MEEYQQQVINSKKWWARIYIDSEQKSLGLHDTLEEAAEFYNKAYPIIDGQRRPLGVRGKSALAVIR